MTETGNYLYAQQILEAADHSAKDSEGDIATHLYAAAQVWATLALVDAVRANTDAIENATPV